MSLTTDPSIRDMAALLVIKTRYGGRKGNLQNGDILASKTLPKIAFTTVKISSCICTSGIHLRLKIEDNFHFPQWCQSVTPGGMNSSATGHHGQFHSIEVQIKWFPWLMLLLHAGQLFRILLTNKKKSRWWQKTEYGNLLSVPHHLTSNLSDL